MKVIDGEGAILGRLSTYIAKELLKGEEITLVNCEKIIVSNPDYATKRYMQKRALQHKGNPELSPKLPKVPHMFVKRVIRGMLPKKNFTGRSALKRLKVYEGVPEDIKEKPIKVEQAYPKNLKTYTTVLKICQKLGWNNG